MASFPAVSGASDPSQQEDTAANEQQANAWIQQVNRQIAELSASRNHDREQAQALRVEIQTQQA